MFERITQNWNIWRFLRLGIAIFLITDSISRKEWLLTFIGGIILYQAMFNIGCAGGSCAVPNSTKTEKENEL
mgnify:CR=1 FL=1